ncbi:MAG: protein-L-isoaspartate O-methyltransferase, partial [Deltaproteobacteria bacterium]|nr:protein-L-isoaspartate O-methyltransferase [Deltaproteobacteria bacterium]
IIVSAGAPRIPSLLVDQLSEGGRLVIPVGQGDEQQIAVVRRQGDSYSMTTDTKCRYVDLLGRYGFGGTPPAA